MEHMSEWAMTTDAVRKAWSGGGFFVDPEDWEIRAAMFDRWLAVHDQEVKAEGWDEGYDDASGFHEGYYSGGHWDMSAHKDVRTWVPDPAPVNPYRRTE